MILLKLLTAMFGSMPSLHLLDTAFRSLFWIYSDPNALKNLYEPPSDHLNDYSSSINSFVSVRTPSKVSSMDKDILTEQ